MDVGFSLILKLPSKYFFFLRIISWPVNDLRRVVKTWEWDLEILMLTLLVDNRMAISDLLDPF